MRQRVLIKYSEINNVEFERSCLWTNMNVAYRELCYNINYIRSNRKYLFKITYSWWKKYDSPRL
jgi:hypothetical protein